MKTLIGNNGQHIYQQIANNIEQLIMNEVLKVGDKLPSVRILSKEHGISMSTAFQAYYSLEGKGLIESRPKSGYYVKYNPKKFPKLPQKPVLENIESDFSITEIVSRVYKDLDAENVVKFSLAIPPAELLPVAKLNKAILRALQTTKDSGTYYEHTQGNQELRRQISKLAFNWSGEITENEIIVTTGCSEALVISLKAATKPGDAVAIESPTYFGMLRVLELLGLKAVEISTDPVTGVDLDMLRKNIAKFNIKACLFIPNFNNPLGCCMPDDNKRELVELLAEGEIPLIEDDIYGELYFGPQRPRTCKSFDKHGLVLYCTSVTKSAAPGFRIGWAIPGRFLEKAREVKVAYSGPTATVTQAALAYFLGNGRYEYHLKEMRNLLYKQCLKYIRAITEYFPDDTCVSRPQGGFVLWVELNKDIDTFRLHQEAIKQNISIAPGHIFSLIPRYKNCMRISFGHPWSSEIERGLKTIGKIAQEMVAGQLQGK
jgi:DNA-binding transcriptional MocR family regulator